MFAETPPSPKEELLTEMMPKATSLTTTIGAKENVFPLWQ